jgi:excisionase family DNA binding protein
MKQFLNASEVAKLLKVNRATVSRWIKNGQIKGVVRVDGKQQWQIPLSMYGEISKRRNEGS